MVRFVCVDACGVVARQLAYLFAFVAGCLLVGCLIVLP